MSETDPPDRWHLVIAPQPGHVPADVRMRAWLKRGLRDYGLRCVSAGDRCPDAAPDPVPVEAPAEEHAP